MTEEHDILVEDFRATSDAMVADLERLKVMEDRKRRLDPEDPTVAELSQQIVELSRRVHQTSLVQRELSEEIADDEDDGEPRRAVSGS